MGTYPTLLWENRNAAHDMMIRLSVHVCWNGRIRHAFVPYSVSDDAEHRQR